MQSSTCCSLRKLCFTMVVIAGATLLPVCESLSQTARPEFPLRVTIVGSGGGPQVNVERFGPSILVEAGDEVLLFDCGRGATIRLTQLGVPLREVNKVFLTHLHSDHIIDVPDLYLTAWGAPPGRRAPFEIWGPAGTRDMMDHIRKAFEFDIRVRGPGLPQSGITVLSHDIDEGMVFERNGVKVTAFLVDHGTVVPAFGYRVDFGDYSVAMSGDTRFSENLIRYARGVDLIIHEAADPDELRRIFRAAGMPPPALEALVENVVAHHTLPEEAGEVFSRVEPRLAVFAHATNSPNLLTRTRRSYSGPLETGGEDMMTIEIGEAVVVLRFGQ